MVITPAVRGLFGLDYDALGKALFVHPHLPASWDRAVLHNVKLGNAQFDLEYVRQSGNLIVRTEGVCLKSTIESACAHQLIVPLPGAEIEIPHSLPQPGTRTSQLKVV